MFRIDAGPLDDSQIEKLGDTLMKLEMKMEKLNKTFNFTDSDLNTPTSPSSETSCAEAGLQLTPVPGWRRN